MQSGSCYLPPIQRDVLSGEVEDTGSVDSCLQYLDPRAGLCPHSMSFTLLRLALDCTSTRPRNRPTMENVSQLNTIQCNPVQFSSIQLNSTLLSWVNVRIGTWTWLLESRFRVGLFVWFSTESDLNQTWAENSLFSSLFENTNFWNTRGSRR